MTRSYTGLLFLSGMMTEGDTLHQELPDVTVQSILSPVYLSPNSTGGTTADALATDSTPASKAGESSTETGVSNDAAVGLIGAQSRPDNTEKKTESTLDKQKPEGMDNEEFKVKSESIGMARCKEAPAYCDLPTENKIEKSTSATKNYSQDCNHANSQCIPTSIPWAMVPTEGLSNSNLCVEVKAKDVTGLTHQPIPQLSQNMVLSSANTQLQGIVTQTVQSADTTATIITAKQDSQGTLGDTIVSDQPSGMGIACPDCLGVFPTSIFSKHCQDFHPNSASCQAAVESLFGAQTMNVIDQSTDAVNLPKAVTLQQRVESHAASKRSSNARKLQQKKHSHAPFQVKDGDVKCHLCDFIGSDESKIQHHLQMVHHIEVCNSNMVVECFICQTKLAGMKQARNHIRRKHRDHPLFEDALIKAWPDRTSKGVVQGDMHCPECLKAIPITFMRRHLKAIHSDSPTFADALRIVKRKIRQNREHFTRNQTKRCTCLKCGLVLTKQKLRHHIGNQLCQRRVLRNLVLADPSKGHLLGTPSSIKKSVKKNCKECGQFIIKPVKLIRCPNDDCDRVFIRKYSLKRHIEISHLGTVLLSMHVTSDKYLKIVLTFSWKLLGLTPQKIYFVLTVSLF